MLRPSLLFVFAPLLAAALVQADAHDAYACGGCFHPPPGPTEVESVVTDHRMVFSISTTQTVLWDQIRYSGSPAEFAWVLPIHPGARIELSHDAFLAALDAATQTVITGPSPACYAGGGGGGGGCAFMGGSSVESAAYAPAFGDDASSTPGVQVVDQKVVGPYESVTLRASQGDALDTWLTANGFVIPDAVRPTLAAYASEGFDFIALKLAPGEDVRAMQPVRVVTPGADPALPLRMVAAGVGARVGLELFVIGEGRYHTANFPDGVVDFSKLAWDPKQDRSNYTELEQAAMDTAGGTAWVTEFAGPMPSGAGGSPSVVTGVRALYDAKCVPTLATLPCPSPPPSDAAAPDADTDASPDAATADAAPPPPPVDAGLCGVPMPVDACDDVDVATAGMHAADVWVTRLRADLPVSALGTGDLVLGAVPTQTPVTNQHATSQYIDPAYDPCPKSTSSGGGDGGACACRTAGERESGWAMWGLLMTCVSGAALTLRKKGKFSGRK